VGGGPAALLARLRGDAARRPLVDPGLAGGLREWLEDGVADLVPERAAAGPPLIVDRWALVPGARPVDGPAVTTALARDLMVGALFRQFVVTGRIGDPVADALAALRVDDRDDSVMEFLRRLPLDERSSLHRQVAAHARLLVTRWPPVAPGWLPKTADRVSVPLAGGRIVLSAVLDLVLGAPAGDRASVCVVDVRSGERRAEHRDDLHFLGLLETVRAGAPPFRLATYYTATGEVDVEDVDDALLSEAVLRTIDGVRRALPAAKAAA
jgi:hypothetical protein